MPRNWLQRPAGHVGEGTAAEVRHDRALLVEGVPEGPSPVRADGARVIDRPFPGQHALAGAADGLEEQYGVRLGGRGPAGQGSQFGGSPDERVRSDVARLGVQGRGPGDVIGTVRLSRRRGLHLPVEEPAQFGHGSLRGHLEFAEAVERRVDPVQPGVRRRPFHLIPGTPRASGSCPGHAPRRSA